LQHLRRVYVPCPALRPDLRELLPNIQVTTRGSYRLDSVDASAAVLREQASVVWNAYFNAVAALRGHSTTVLPSAMSRLAKLARSVYGR